MLLTENPFYILGVSTTDTREKILEQADLKSLEKDPVLCSQAKSILTHPKNRLYAELTWLAGVTPTQANEIIEKIKKEPVSLSEIMKDMEPLSKCNLICYAISINNYKDIDVWINFLCFTFSQINVNSLFNLINGNRKLANFTPLNNTAIIEDELINYKKYLSKSVINALDKTEFPEKILSQVISNITSSVSINIPEIVGEIVAAYHLEIKKYIEKIDSEIQKYIQIIVNNIKQTENKGTNIQSKIVKIQYLLKFWYDIILPVQLYNLASGIEDEDSTQVFQKIRQLALFLSNSYLLHKAAFDLVDILHIVLAKYPKFNELLTRDKETLQSLLT